MANCLVAQSGGPTAVINASLAGVIRANQLNPLYDRVLGGLHGIEGTLAGNLFDLTDLSGHEIEVLKQTPSCALGTCRYKFSEEADFQRLIDVMDENDISTMFYIGGNGSMSTVAAMTAWAAERNLDKRFIGIPKTVDNDLGLMDHCPGFASAAKVACEITHATRMDYDAYTRPEVFVLETMGRDAGWLAASTCLTGDVDLLCGGVGRRALVRRHVPVGQRQGRRRAGPRHARRRRRAAEVHDRGSRHRAALRGAGPVARGALEQLRHELGGP